MGKSKFPIKLIALKTLLFLIQIRKQFYFTTNTRIWKFVF